MQGLILCGAEAVWLAPVYDALHGIHVALCLSGSRHGPRDH